MNEKALSKRECYETIARHIFIAYSVYSETYEPFIILADDLEEAKIIVQQQWPDREMRISQAHQAGHPQIYD